MVKSSPKCRKQSGKRRNCSLRAISPFPTVFGRLVLQTHKNKGFFGKCLTLSSILYTHFNTLKKKPWENIVEKGEVAQNKQFHLFL